MRACDACFVKSLRYESPAHGGWGIIKMATQVPETHLLFFSPPACGRHGALSSVVNGIKDKVSYCCFTETEIVNGTYIDSFVPAVDELLETLPQRPRAILLYTACIDDMMGTDRPRIQAELEARHPDVKFRFCQMDPIKLDNAKQAPGVTLFVHIYDLLAGERRKKDPTHVDLLGNVVAQNEDGELGAYLRKAGVRTITQLPTLRTFDEFLTMADASLALVLHPRAIQGARHLERISGIPFLPAFCTYDPDEIDDFYRSLAQELSRTMGKAIAFDTEGDRERAEAAFKETKAAIGGRPIAIDFQAVTKPYTLAKTLLERGFNVRLIATDGVSGPDQAALQWIAAHHPDVEVSSPLASDAPKYAYRTTDADDLCIGFDCGDMVGSEHVAGIMEDDDHFGYAGVRELCRKLREAAAGKTVLKTMIKEANLVV